MAINPNEINIKNIIELIQSSSIQDNDLLVIGQGIYARKSTVLELYNKFGVPSILTSLNSLQFQINQLNNTVGNSVLYSPQVKTPQQKADARNNLDVYSRSETQTVVNTVIVNLGNVVNSVTNVNPALVNNSDPKNPVIAEFREISDYNNDMLNKADIDGNLTTGGVWWQDQVLSDRFANYKQVWTALTNNTIEWGNIELDKHIFLVDDINGLKIKVGGTEGTIWNTLNLTNVSQLVNDANYTTLPIVQSWVGTQGFFQFPSGGNSGQYLNGLGQLVNFPTIPPQLVYTGSNGINVTGTVISPTYGTTSGTIAQGNDARFHNAVTLGTANGLSLAGQVLSLGLANATNNGALSSTDWNTFNSKVSANNGQLSFTAPTGLNISGTFNANQISNTVIPLTWQAGYQGFTTAESNKLSTVENNATRTRITGDGDNFVSGDIGIYGEGGTESRQDGTKIYLSQSSFRTEFFVYSNTSVTVPNTDTDKVIQKSGSGAITVTLSNGQRNGQKLNIKWGGTSNFTVQGNMYDSGANVSSLTMNSNSLPRLSLIWNSSNGRWWLT